MQPGYDSRYAEERTAERFINFIDTNSDGEVIEVLECLSEDDEIELAANGFVSGSVSGRPSFKWLTFNTNVHLKLKNRTISLEHTN